jgi:transposase
MHVVEGIPKKEIARRFSLDIKTVRRALGRQKAVIRRVSPRRPRQLDPYREQIEMWIRCERRVTAKRIAVLLEPQAGRLSERGVREYVAEIRAQIYPKEAFVHRTHAPGDTLEGDFGDSAAVIASVYTRVKFFVAVLPACNAYFAKAYPVERLECLLDGLCSAFLWFGGLPRRGVFDNTSLAVRDVLRGPDRIEQRAFEAFRGAFPFHADFCAPAKGWEKGSVEGGVDFVRDNCFRPMPHAASFDELNLQIVADLERDLDRRKLPDGRTIREALIAEREHLRPLPASMPDTCRFASRVVNKFGHVRLDGIDYSVPIRFAYRPVMLKAFYDRVEIVAADAVVASHVRDFRQGAKVLDPLHVLSLLEKKHRAVPEATAIQQWKLDPVFHELRERLRPLVRKPDREWISILRLLEEHPQERVAAAVREAIERTSPRLETIRLLLRRRDTPVVVTEPAWVSQPELAQIVVEPPSLAAYDVLGEVER